MPAGIAFSMPPFSGGQMELLVSQVPCVRGWEPSNVYICGVEINSFYYVHKNWWLQPWALPDLLSCWRELLPEHKKATDVVQGCMCW